MLQTSEVYNMDCMEGIKLLDDKSIDLVLIDPPYLLNLNKVKNTTSINNYANELIGLKDGFDLKVLDLLVQKMKKINIYIFCSKRQVKDLLQYFVGKGCNYEILTWHKQNPSPLKNNNYLPDTEYVIFAREKGVRLYGNYRTKRKYYISGVNQVDKKKWNHPTIKPLPFIENLIINSSNIGDLVLDCYCGSGTTLVGAIKTNRNFIGFEIDKNYYEIAKQRVAETLTESKVNERKKDSFMEEIRKVEDEETKLLKLQKQYRSGEIKKEDLTEEQIKSLNKLYNKQITNLRKSNEIRKQKLLEYRRKLQTNN